MKPVRYTAFLVAAAALAVTTACLIGSDRPKTLRAGELDYKLGPFTYLEEGKIVGFAVGTEAARYREKENYMPLAIGVANKDAGTIKLGRESFVLQDENGRRYPMVPVNEITGSYGPTQLDRSLTTFRDIFLSHFQTYDRVSSNFFPERASGGIVIDDVELPNWRYVMDLIYFPKPDGGIVGRRFELHMTAPGLTDDVFVKFKVD